jgi:hypothetical protein
MQCTRMPKNTIMGLTSFHVSCVNVYDIDLNSKGILNRET